MATSVTINKLDYANVPAGIQSWTLQYKLWNASSYTLLSNNASVNTDGTLGSPITFGVTAGQLYYVQAYPNCSSPYETFIQQIQT